MDRLNLEGGRWYGWQLLPGYSPGYSPYYSPILVVSALPEKSGHGWLGLEFFNAFYAEGVQGFSLRLQVVERSKDYLIARIGNSPGTERHVIVSRISFEWIASQFPEWYQAAPRDSMPAFASSEIDYYLSQRFFGTLRPLETRQSN